MMTGETHDMNAVREVIEASGRALDLLLEKRELPPRKASVDKQETDVEVRLRILDELGFGMRADEHTRADLIRADERSLAFARDLETAMGTGSPGLIGRCRRRLYDALAAALPLTDEGIKREDELYSEAFARGDWPSVYNFMLSPRKELCERARNDVERMERNDPARSADFSRWLRFERPARR